MKTPLPRAQWETVLAEAGELPTFGEVVRVLDESDVVDAEPVALVEGALEDGLLVEEGAGFGSIRLSAESDSSDSDAPEETDPDPSPEPAPADTDVAAAGSWADAQFTAPEDGIWCADQAAREQWMGHKSGDKAPFAPWADADAPVECSHESHDSATTCAECSHHAGFKWGSDGSAEHVHTDFATARDWADHDPRLAGLAYIQSDDDGLMFVDGDDVIDPETGEPHPAFVAFLEHLGVTYADISVSGSGCHAVYRGALPEGVAQAVIEIDTEPWGANDEVPAVEFYDSKHVCIATGKHIPGTPTEARDVDEDGLEAILRASGDLSDGPDASAGALDDFDSEDHIPAATSADETTSDIRDIFAAIDRLDAQEVADRTIVREWVDPSGAEHRAMAPTWAPSDYSGTAVYVDQDKFVDSGRRGGLGGPVCMAAIADPGIAIEDTDCPDSVEGDTWWQAVDALRELGYPIPEYDPDRAAEGAVSAVPMKMLSALDGDDARRFAKKRGVSWPTTDDVRDRLEDRIVRAIAEEEHAVIEAPTSAGKSFTVATTPWLEYADVTDEAPVIQFSPTREARDGAIQDTRQHGGRAGALKGRKDLCSVAAGDHDPQEDASGDVPDQVVTVRGMSAEAWFDALCDGKGVPFSVAHKLAEDHNDQGLRALPCCSGATDEDERGDCPALTQWEGIPRDDDGHPTVDVVHATHQFAYVPSLIRGCNVVFDERPDFGVDLSHDRIQRAVTAWLKQADVDMGTWEQFVQTARYRGGDTPGQEYIERDLDDLREAFDEEPDREWYLEESDAHTLAPALARAIFYALREDEDANGRRSATVPHAPPRLDEHAHDEDGWNRTWLSVVLDEDNRVRTARNSPDLSLARAVVGLDAHPCPPLWERNVDPSITIDRILDREERRLWRLFERGLAVVQVGDATRPLASGEYFDPDGAGALIRHLRDEYGERFRTAITAKSVDPQLKQLMEEAGIDDPQTMHYGMEKSRNDFADEDIGLVNGSIDPGDDYVVDLLAEIGLEATPETTTDGDGEEHRAHGRGFTGPDAGTAAALLASVRENHVAQAAGRYARDADTREARAVVFVRTDAIPPGFADVKVPGVEWVATETQAEIARTLAARPTATAGELAEETGASKRHISNTLRRFVEGGVVECREGAGQYGAHIYRAVSGVPPEGVVDTEEAKRLATPQEIAKGHVWDSYTWSFAIHSLQTPGARRERQSARATGVNAEEVPDGQSQLDSLDGGERE